MSEKKPKISKGEPTYDKAAWDEFVNNPKPLSTPDEIAKRREKIRNAPKQQPLSEEKRIRIADEIHESIGNYDYDEE